MSEQLERFITLLKGIFELDKSDLDFGIYRIMNIRKKEIEKFLTEGLPQKVQDALKPFATDTAAAEARIKEIEAQLGGSASIAALPQTVPMVKEYAELKTLLAKGVDLSGLEADVYSHLYSFFNRYYEEGDFISKRRYKEGVYAIPYEGEEVKLYWANQDQYYIKTSENFKDYTFIAEGYTIHFKLVDATTEQNNNKESADSKRVFMLYTENPEQPELKTFEFDADKKEFIIRFIFDVPPEKKFDYAADNARKIVQWIAANCSPLVTVLLPNISADPKKPLTLIEKHLNAYVAKNTFDYFIHKDLHKFLSRELDFYIKNEVMHLDDVDTPNEKQVETYLAKIRAIKRVGTILIEFLSSIENFQKKLWLKKKFVIQCDYCITLDRIPEEFYSEIAANEEQREEWVKLCAIDKITAQQGGMEQGGWFKDASGKMDVVKRRVAGRKFGYSVPLKVGFLRENRFLMVDTKFFSDDFKYRLQAAFDDFDKQCDGLLIHSENFQAESFIGRKYRNKIDCFYYDPPYNTSETSFLYKNGYRDSSWNTMMNDRYLLSQPLFTETSVICTAIDDLELSNVIKVCDNVFHKENRLGNLVIEIKPSGRTNDNFLATSHEYIVIYGNDPQNTEISFFPLTEEQKAAYTNGTGNNSFKWRDFLRTGGFSTPEERPNSFYPIYYNPSTHEISVDPLDPSVEIWPIDSVGKKRVWRKTKPSLKKHIEKGEIKIVFRPKSNDYKVQIIDKIKSGIRPKSVWTESKYDAATYGTKWLKHLFGSSSPFSFPKSIYAVYDTLFAVVNNQETALILDIFAGSGTTAEAVIRLNHAEEEIGDRKYILVEMGEYFDVVLVPRIKKVVYATTWKDGLPQEIPSIKGKHIIEESKKVLKTNDGAEDLLSFEVSYNGTEVEENPDWREDNPFNGVSHCFKYMTLESYEDALSNVVLPDEQTTGHLIARFGDEYLVKYMLDLNAAGSVLNLKAFAEPFSYKLKVTEKNETKEVNVDLMETFNYLIGLTVVKLYARNTFTASLDPQGEYEGAVKLTADKLGNYTFRQIEGKLPDGGRCLVIWRNITDNLTESNAALDAYFLRYHINPADREYDVIYVNGDNNLENLKTDAETWKVQMIEPEFKKRMFEEE